MTEINESSKKDKVFNLTTELLELQGKKKSVVKAFNEEIKRLKAEIKDQVVTTNLDEVTERNILDLADKY